MAESFLHGVEVIELDFGARPIRTVRSAVIGLIGTAPDAVAKAAAVLESGDVAKNDALTFTAVDAGSAGNGITVRFADPGANSQALSVTVKDKAITVHLATDGAGDITSTAAQVMAAVNADADASALVTVTATGASTGVGVLDKMRALPLIGGQDDAFPLDTPVLVAGSRLEAAKLGNTGTLPAAIDAIFDQVGAMVVVVRVAKGASDAATQTNIIGGVNATTGQYTGLQAFLAAETTVKVQPKILVAPGFSHEQAVISEFLGVADKLRAVVIADGPNTTDAAAITFREKIGSPRVYVVDPWVKVWDIEANAEAVQPASARVAGMIARSDQDRGFWWSPSNTEMYGITGTARGVDFTLGDINSRANYLNEHEVSTVICKDGFRLWGNRTCSADPKWAFLNVRRTADMVNESLLRAHMWAVDRNITKTYVQDVLEGVNAYLRHLVAVGAIIGGKCWADPELNTPDQIAQGKVYFDFDFSPCYPAEHIIFRSRLTNDYLEEIFA